MFTNILNSLDFTKGENPTNKSSFLLNKQVEQLYGNSNIALSASIVISIFALGLLWQRVSSDLLIGWFSFVVVVALLRFYLNHQYFSNNLLSTSTWFKIFLLGIALNGMLWGSLIILSVQQSELLIIGLSTLLVAGLCAGVAVSASSSLPAYFAFVIPALLPGCLFFIIQTSQQITFLGACLFAYFIFLSMLELKFHERSIQDLNLQSANQQLSICLKNTFDRINDGVVIVDVNTKTVVDANKQALSLLKFEDEKQLIGCSYDQILKSDTKDIEQIFKCIIDKKVGTRDRQQYILQTDKEVTLQLSATVINAGERELIVVIIHIDNENIISLSRKISQEQNMKLNTSNIDKHSISEKKEKIQIDKLRIKLNDAFSNILMSIYSLDKILGEMPKNATHNLDTILSSTKKIQLLMDDLLNRIKSTN